MPTESPHNPSLNDVAAQFAPWAKAVRMALKEGSLPFWDRWNGCGMPLAANGQSQAFSPFTLLMLTLPLARAFVLLGASKLFLALSGMWLWLRELGASSSAARLGAILFAFSFAVTPWLYHPASAEICLWPWVFFAAELLADRAVSNRGFVLLVPLLAAWPLCGHLETASLGALFGGLWFGLRALAGDMRKPRVILRKASLAAVTALGLSAFQLLPQIHAIEASNRLELAKDPSRFNFVPWVPYRPGWLGGFVTSLFPRAFGDMIDSPMISGAAGSIVEMGSGYFGVIGWSCALLVVRGGSRRRPKEWILLALVLVGLGGAMGLPVFRAIVEALPGIRLLPPLRLLLLVSVAGAPLAALEMDRLIEDHSLDRKASVFLVGTSLFIAAFAVAVFALLRAEYAAAGGLAPQAAALAWTLAVSFLAAGAAMLFTRKTIAATTFAFLITGLAALELLHQGMRLYRFSSAANLYPETPLIRFLHSQPLPYRIAGDGGALFPNTNLFALVESIETHDPAERRDYVEFLDKTAGYSPFQYFKKIRNLNSPVLDFLNVKYLVTPPGRQTPGAKWTLVYEGPDGRVFQNRDVLSRVFAPRRIRLVSALEGQRGPIKNAVLAFGGPLEEFLAAGSFSGEAVVLKSQDLMQHFPGSGQNGSVEIKDPIERTNRIQFGATVSGGPTILVSSLVTDGGWSARDESGAQLVTSLANGPFLAVCLPPGNHVVTLKYVPPGFRLGAVVSAATFLMLVTVVSLRRRRLPEGCPDGK